MPDASEVFGAESFRAKVKMVEAQIEKHPVEQQEALRTSLLKNLTREQAIIWGKALGEDEANRRRETGSDRDGRIKRAMMYAAWEYDGKPIGQGETYRREFGVEEPKIAGFLEREEEWRKRGEQS